MESYNENIVGWMQQALRDNGIDLVHQRSAAAIHFAAGLMLYAMDELDAHLIISALYDENNSKKVEKSVDQ